jgi:hypothetical protein
MRTIFLTVILFFAVSLNAQILTKEDSLSAGLIASNNATVISGYGSIRYTNNVTLDNATINMDRLVLFVGHKFNKKISFFSELELEDAKVVGGSPSGEFSIEQAFLKFNLTRSMYLTAGLFIPRIGIINENHLPNTYNGVSRPFVERFIIPSTWRELGVGLYGTSKRIAGFNYSLSLVNGLSSAGFVNGTGIREGRFEGSNASASALAVTGSLLHYSGNFRTQLSAYYGGSAGITKREADSLQLNSGIFGTPVALTEANIQYSSKRIALKALAVFVAIPDAEKINRAYANNTPEQMFGAYLEAGYNFYTTDTKIARVFTRYEYLNLNMKLPNNGILNETINQQYMIAGFSFLPIQGVIIKFDYTYRLTGDVNPALIINPYPQNVPFFKQQHLFNLGIGYSF